MHNGQCQAESIHRGREGRGECHQPDAAKANRVIPKDRSSAGHARPFLYATTADAYQESKRGKDKELTAEGTTLNAMA